MCHHHNRVGDLGYTQVSNPVQHFFRVHVSPVQCTAFVTQRVPSEWKAEEVSELDRGDFGAGSGRKPLGQPHVFDNWLVVNDGIVIGTCHELHTLRYECGNTVSKGHARVG